MDVWTDKELVDAISGDPKSIMCWACGANIDAGDNYCRRCGKGQGGCVRWYYKHWGVLVLTLAMGPFALYFVWRSPVLSRNAKWTYTALISLFTWYVAGVFYNFWLFFQAMLGGMQLPY